jgi:adenylate cyclase
MGRRLAAILAADIAGYSKLMAEDEVGTLARLKAHRLELFDPKVAEHEGRIVKLMGDGTLVEFASVVEAVECAMAIQSASAQADDSFELRIGIHLGDIVVEGDDIYGDGVNIAARLEGLAPLNGIAISDDAYRQVRDRLDIVCRDLGEQELKNIPRPIRLWEWRASKPAPTQLVNSVPSLPDKPSIVLMPLRNLAGDPECGSICDGLRIDIQNALVQVSGLFLTSVASANAFEENTAQMACRHLGVQYALQGSVRKAGNRLRVAVDLTDSITGQFVWAENFDRVIDDIFLLTDDITARVLTAMNVELVTGEAAKVWHKTLRDRVSLKAFYKGIFEFHNMSRESIKNARRQFETVAKHHPDASMGATWIALTHWYDLLRGWSDNPENSKDLARRWAKMAAAMEDTDGQAHTVLSHIYLMDRDFDAALEAGRGAIINRPNCAYANGFYANVLHYCDLQQEAIHHVRLALRYAPIHPPVFKDILALALREAGNTIDAVDVAKEAISVNPRDVIAHLVLASCLVRLNERERASKLVIQVETAELNFSIERFFANQPYKDQALLDQFVTDLKTAGFVQ